MATPAPDTVRNIVSELIAKLDQLAMDYCFEVAPRVADALYTPLKVALCVYIAAMALAYIRGLVSNGFDELLMRVFKATMVIAVGLNTAVYLPVIANAIFQTSNELASLVINSGSPEGVMDAALDKINAAALEFVKAGSLAKHGVGVLVVQLLAGAIVWLCGALVVGMATLIICIAKIALSVLLGVGPFFIFMALFKPTKRFFESWVSYTLNLMMIYPLVLGAIAILLKLWEPEVEYVRDNPMLGIAGVIPMGIVSMVVWTILKQIPGIASSLMGGLQLSEGGTANAVGRSVGQLASGVKNLATKLHPAGFVQNAISGK